MKPPFSYLPALPVAIGWMAGILLWSEGLGWGAAAVYVSAGIVIMLARWHYIAFGLYAVAAGWAVAEANRPAEAPPWAMDGRERLVSARIREVHASSGALTLVVDVDSVSGHPVMPFGMQIATLPQWMPPAEGCRVRALAKITPLDAGGHFPYQADYSTLFLRRGVVAGSFMAEEELAVVGRDESILTWFADQRRRIVGILAHSGLSDRAYGLEAALLTGEGDGLAPEIKENFRATGIAHALALSGFHVGWIVMLVSVALFPLRAWRGLLPLRVVFGLLALWCYVAMVGFGDSVVRAAVMLTVFMAGQVLGRGANPFNSLCVAATVILAVRPYSVFSAGFQMSVCAVLGLLAFSCHLNPFGPADGWRFRLCEAMAVPVAAVMGTMPLTALWFHRFPLAFIVSNLVVVMLLPLLMLGGIVLVMAGFMDFRLGWVEWVVNKLTDFVAWFTDRLAAVGWAELSGVHITPGQAVVMAAVLSAFATGLAVRSRRGWCAAGIVLAVGAVAFPLCAESDPVGECFVAGSGTSSPVVVRYAEKVVVIPRGRNHLRKHAAERACRELAGYFEARGVDSVLVTGEDFSLGPFERRGAVVLHHRSQR